MIAWRLCRRPHADLNGDGARLFGGRWNSRGRPIVYLAEHPALAALEVRVHLDLPFELLPVDFVLMRIAVPDADIMAGETSADTVAAGDTWLSEARSPGLRVASVLVPHSWNILLNPRHPHVARAAIHEIEVFLFDPRLWQPLVGEH